VTAGFGKEKEGLEDFEKWTISRFQGDSAGSNPVGDTRSNASDKVKRISF